MIRSNSTRKLALTAHVGQVYKINRLSFFNAKSLEERNLTCINNIFDDYKFAIIIAPPPPYYGARGGAAPSEKTTLIAAAKQQQRRQ